MTTREEVFDKIQHVCSPIEESWKQLQGPMTRAERIEWIERERPLWRGLMREITADLATVDLSADDPSRVRVWSLWVWEADIHSRDLCFDVIDAVDAARKRAGIS